MPAPTAGERAHRAVCLLRLHLWGRWRTKKGVAGRVRTCQCCGLSHREGPRTVQDAIAAQDAGHGLRSELVQ